MKHANELRDAAAYGSPIPFIDYAKADAAARPSRRRLGEPPRDALLFAALAQECAALLEDPGLVAGFDAELLGVVGRPSPLQPAFQLSAHAGGARIYLKREDFSGDDRHLLLSVAGQGVVARRLGRRMLVAGTRDGRLGVITAQVAARLGLKATIYIDRNDAQRHSANVFRMKLLGASVCSIDVRSQPQGDIREAALADWACQSRHTFLVLGLDAAPEPYPALLRYATSGIGRECRRQLQLATRRLPAAIVARGGDTADALGVFPAFLDDPSVELVCVEPAALPAVASARTSDDPFELYRRPLSAGEDRATQSILQGLEYPSVRREHEWLRASGRVRREQVSPDAVKQAIADFSQLEGFIPPLETAQVLAQACAMARGRPADEAVLAVVAQQGRQDIWDVARLMGVKL